MPAFYSDEDFARLQAAGRDHLWLHFSRHSVYEQGEMPVIVRGEPRHAGGPCSTAVWKGLEGAGPLGARDHRPALTHTHQRKHGHGNRKRPTACPCV